MCLSASTQGMAERVLVKIGRPELVKDPKFATNIERVRNGLELDAIIGGFIAERDLATNLKFFDEAGVTIGPVYDISQIVQDDYVLEREALIEVPDEEMGELPTHPVVPRLSGTPGTLRTAAPKIGEHNEALLKPLLGAAEYDKLCQSGVISKGKEEVNRPPPPVWRSILYVPGNVPKFIDKAHERGADCILVDLEDSVTVAEKPTARAMLPETMKKVVRGGADVAVRINRPMRLAIPDIEAAVRPGLVGPVHHQDRGRAASAPARRGGERDGARARHARRQRRLRRHDRASARAGRAQRHRRDGARASSP